MQTTNLSFTTAGTTGLYGTHNFTVSRFVSEVGNKNIAFVDILISH